MSRAQDLGVDRMRSHASRLPTSYLVVERIHALAQESPSLGLSDANSKSRIDVEEILSHLERLHNRAISSGLFGVSAVLLQAASSIRDLSPSSARGTHSEALDTALSSPVDSCASEIVQPDGAKSVDDPVQSPSGEPDLGHDIDDGFMDQGGSPSMSSPNFYVIPHDRNTSTPNEWLHHPSEIDDGQLQELVHLAIGLTPSLEATRDDSTTTHTTVNPSVFASAANGDTGAAKATRHNAKAASKLPRLVKGGYFGTRRRATGKRGSQGTQSRNSAQALNSNGDVVATSSTSVRTPSAIRDRKITNGGELTVSKMLRILQEFDRKASEPAAAESTTAESTTADSTTTESTPANRMQGFSKGLYDAIEDLPKYLARLLVAVRESSYVSDVDSGYHTVTQGKDRIDYCLVLLERLQRHAARNDVRGLEELCMLHELGAEFESLVKELADDGKAVRDWAKKKRMITETGYSGSIKAICRAYLVEYLVEESRKCTTKFPKDSIGDRLTAAHKLRVLTERLGAGFLLLLARHKNIVGSLKRPSYPALKAFCEKLLAQCTEFKSFTRQLWQSFMSKSGRGESVENDAAHSAPTLHDYLKAIDKTEERAQLFADGCNSLVPIPSDHFLGPSNNDSDVQHLFGQYIRALRERCEDVNGKGKAWLSGIDQVAVARRCVLKHSSTVQGLGTLYDSIPSWPGASPGVGCGVELNGGVQAPCCAEDFKDMLAKPFSIIVVLGETEICSSPSFNRQYDHKSFVQRRSYDVVDSAKEDLSDATHPITHKRFKEILVEPLTKAIMGPSEHRSASAAAEGRSWNFLGIGSNTIFPVPEAVKQVDLLEEILQKINKDPSISVADPDELAAIQSHVEVMRKGFFFAATPGAVSPFHKDKAGLCTMILPQVGVKEWFIPSTDAVEDVTTERLPMPERVAGIRFKPGTLLIQSAGVSHAVYSPELCLAFGRFFYHKFHFARSIDAVRDQILDKTTENETMTATDYLLFTFAIRAMGLVDLRPERLQQQVKAIGDLLEAVGAGLEVGAVDVVSKMAQYMSKNKPITAPCLNACPPWARKLIIEQEKNRKEGRSQRQWSCAQAAHLVRLVRYAQLFYQTNVSTATAGPSTAITRNNSTKRKRA